MNETNEIHIPGDPRLRLHHAQDYPFEQLDRAFLYRDGEVSEGPFDFDGRTAVAAAGSNGSPAQLARKFGQCPEGVPVVPAVIHDYVVVYSAHLTRYGSLPATLWHHPGAMVGVVVTWLTQPQLERMHETEALGSHYEFVDFEGARVRLDAETHEPKLHYYKSLPGPLLHQGKPIRLAEIWTSNCTLPLLSQPAALRYVHKRLETGLDFEAFMERVNHDPAYRFEQMAKLRN